MKGSQWSTFSKKVCKLIETQVIVRNVGSSYIYY